MPVATAGHYSFIISGVNESGQVNIPVTGEGRANGIIPLIEDLLRLWYSNRLLLGYLPAILIAGYFLRRYELTRLRLKDRVRIADIETRKLRDTDQLKSRFFANISHEFRTPLTLIKGPIEQLLEEETEPARRVVLSKMHQNAGKLLHLVNQLLELARIEGGKYSLKLQKGNFSKLLKHILIIYEDLARQKDINLSLVESPELSDSSLSDRFYFDPDIVEKVIANLLTNSIKFTPEKGRVTLQAEVKKQGNEKEYVEVIVTDSGIGIPPDKLPYIFDRFYQAHEGDNYDHYGSGIGLAYVKELARVHNAEITAESLDGEGSQFVLRFPVGKEHFLPGQIAGNRLNSARGDHSNEGKTFNVTGMPVWMGHERKEVAASGETVLVVEDNKEIRQYILLSLSKEYQVFGASGAEDGMKIARELVPDIIVSDIMMPGTDGYKFCSMIKSYELTSHIPVILLTARGGDKDRILGFESGADDYLVKPFIAAELIFRIRNLIQTRRVLRERFSTKSIIRPRDISVPDSDAVFIEKLLRLVEKNIDNSNFFVNELAQGAGMSLSQLHRKLKLTVDMPPINFIRSVRMHRAMELLRKGGGNISEIAYSVGYDDPGYFTKSFRAFFGKPPSAIKSAKH